MAGRPIEIQIMADADASGVEKVADSLENVEDSLENVEDSAKRAGDTLKDEIGDGAKDAAKETERGLKDVEDSLEDVEDAAKSAGKELGNELEDGAEKASDAAKEIDRDLTQALDAVEDKARTTGSTVGKEVDDGFKRAGEGAEEFKDEANSTAREAAASFDGSFDSIADAAQEVLANAFVGWGPAGAAAGLAAAAGIGILISGLQNSAEEATEAKEKIIDLSEQIHEVDGDLSRLDWGQVFRDFANEFADPKSWFEPWQKEAVTNLEAVQQKANELGITFSDLFQGLAGDQEAAARAIEEIDERIDGWNKVLEENTDLTDHQKIAIAGTIAELEREKDALNEATGQTEEAIEMEGLYSEAVGGTTAELEENNEQIEERNEEMAKSRDLVISLAEAEIDYAETLSETTEAIAENGETLDIGTEAGRNNRQALIDLADSSYGLTESLAETGATQDVVNMAMQQGRDDFIAAAEAAGMTRGEANKLADAYGLIPGNVKTQISAPGADNTQKEAADTKRQIEAIPDSHSTDIVFNASTYNAQTAVNRAINGLIIPRVEIPFTSKYRRPV